jgi:hypothetical protein
MPEHDFCGNTLPVNDVEKCQRCENSYIVIWIKESEDYNDFRLRHCPFCGLLTDQLTGSVAI